MVRNRGLKRTLFASVSLIALGGTAAAQTLTINIPSEDLKVALGDYIHQSGVQLVYTVEDMAGRRSHAVQGRYAPSVALEQLLEGTGFVANRDASGAMIVSKRIRTSAADPDPTPASGDDQTPTTVGTSTETIVVTGSLVVTNSINSPTPLLEVTLGQLQSTTPSDIPDALNKLPIFQNSSTPRTPDTGAGSGANVLNMLNFGAQRTLVLLDGRRVPPSFSNGTVDVDTLPEMLVSRVDVVIGGASAVYGSDAVTGVVNYVLNKHFSGVKVDANSGISNYGDGASYKLGLAAGTDLFNGRGHFEGSLRVLHADEILNSARPYGNSADWEATGVGTAANPYVTTDHVVNTSYSFGGKITCTGCASNGKQFVTNGVIGPFNLGTATGTSNLSSGGDGVDTTVAALAAAQNTEEAFGRFSYNLDETTTAFIELSAVQAKNYNQFQNNYIQTGTTANQFYANNAFLTPTAQAQLASSSGVFTMVEYINQPGMNFNSQKINTTMHVTAGLDGSLLDKYTWNLFYTAANSRVIANFPENQNIQKEYAAEDAVVNPANGQVVCNVSLTSYSYLYPGCVPINLFGPTALTPSQYNYVINNTANITTDSLNDVGGNVSGDVFNLPAGPVRMALSSEMRWLDYRVTDFTQVGGTVDCTGLRLCNSAAGQYAGATVSSQPTVSESVWEFAGEANVPLLKDIPLVQSLSADVAGRYTDYSTSGAVETWKLGLVYRVNDDVRFRATNSVDIRAPTLNDLYAPAAIGRGQFTDIHTGNTLITVQEPSRGNPNLVPEVARTYTAGVVFTPSYIPGLTVSADYYNLNLKNAINSISGTSTGIAQACEASGGTSPLCSLFVRPLPFSNTTPANQPTQVLSESVNASRAWTEGYDIELDYDFELASIDGSLPGSMNLRTLANISPYNNTQLYVGAPTIVSTNSKGRVTSFVTYNLNEWTFDLENRWLSNAPRSGQPGILFFQQPVSKHLDYVDLNIKKRFIVDGATYEGYFSVQNVMNSAPPIEPLNFSFPGLRAAGYEPSIQTNRIDGIDLVGRYFTIGIRANF